MNIQKSVTLATHATLFDLKNELEKMGTQQSRFTYPDDYKNTTKPSKMQKEREEIVYWIFKFAGRKNMGFLSLFLVSTVGFIYVLYVWEGEDAQKVQVPLSLHYNGNIQNLSYVGKAYRPSASPYFSGYTLPQEHPCNSFTLRPPPVDKKRTGPRSCPVCYLPLEEAIALMPSAPSFSPVLKKLKYIHEEPVNRKTEFGGSDFGGYPTLKQRRRSFNVKTTMSVHCGFVKGPEPGRGTRFDIDETDLLEMKRCREIVVVSAVFEISSRTSRETEEETNSSGQTVEFKESQKSISFIIFSGTILGSLFLYLHCL